MAGRVLQLAAAALVLVGLAQAFAPPPPRGLLLRHAPAGTNGAWLGPTGLAASVRGRRPFGWRSVLSRRGRSGGGGGGSGGSGGGGGDSFGWSKGGSGDDGEGDDGVALASDVATVLGRAGRQFQDLPAAVQKAIVGGGMTSALLERYLELEKQGGVLGWFLGMGVFRDRLLMDGQLLEKLGIEMAVGAVAQMVAEWDRRREKLWHELDFAFADVLTCLVANFAAVLVAAPAVGAATAATAAASAARHIPANAFQMVPPGGKAYALIDRVISPFLKVPTLFSLGCFASLLGYGTTSVLTSVRQMLEERKAAGGGGAPAVAAGAAASGQGQGHGGGHAPGEIPVLKTSLAVGVYLAVSTNIRYQLISGVLEERVIAKALAGRKAAETLASFAVRSCNTYVGSAMMIDFLKVLGLQS